MREESIVVACDAGIPVVLATTRRAAQLIDRLAEDLLVAGAEVEIVSDIERAPARITAALDRLERPTVIALCHTPEDGDLAVVRALIAAHPGPGHHCVEVGSPGAATALRPVLSAMRELVRHSSDPGIGAVLEAARRSDQATSDAMVMPPPRPIAAPTPMIQQARRRPWHAWAWTLCASAAASAMISTVVLLASEAPASGPSGHREHDALAPAPGKPNHNPTVAERPSPRAELPLPIVRIAAQGPAAVAPIEAPAVDPTPIEPAAALPVATASPIEHDALAIAIERHQAIVDRDVIAHLVVGDRDWYGAMTTCRARGFWRTSGWRVPTVDELRSLARTRAFGDAEVWSSRRGAVDNAAAITVAMRGGTSHAVDKHTSAMTTICVKDRG
jgi:hypothetical protein